MVGEIVAEGDNITAGYWLPDAAKNPFRDGKLYTGDLARVDDEGYIYIVGRNSEFLKLSGHRVSSKEIEDVLFELPEVLEAAVVAIQNPQAGESAKAYLVTRPGAELTSEQIIRHCKQNLPPYAVPHEIAFFDALPKNAAGKILKRELET
jgi:long-chain acyl-CoA synthetase